MCRKSPLGCPWQLTEKGCLDCGEISRPRLSKEQREERREKRKEQSHLRKLIGANDTAKYQQLPIGGMDAQDLHLLQYFTYLSPYLLATPLF